MSSEDQTGVPALPARLIAGAVSLRVTTRLMSLRAETIWNYFQLLGGSVGRLGLSLCYFLALTRSLSLQDFGLFASAVAVGTVLARLAAFGYGANVLQVSATRPRTLGHYFGIYGVWLAASLPPMTLAACGVYWLSFKGSGELAAYLAVIASEAVLWKALDTISTVNSGLGRFGFAATAYNIGTATRAAAALIFLPMPGHTIGHWAAVYFVANAAALALVAVLLMPRVRLRLRRGTLLLRWRNALAMGSSGFATSLQAEIDKVLVLTFAGPVTAGLYAICIRVIDLTAVPIRAFNVIMIQRVLKNPGNLEGGGARLLTEIAIAVTSTATFGVLLVLLRIWPDLLGRDVGKAVPLFALLIAVPAFRNLIEYQGELLYAHGRMVFALWVALVLTAAKTLMMAAVFWLLGRGFAWAVPMNAVFLVSYGLSAAMTYRALRVGGRMERKR